MMKLMMTVKCFEKYFNNKRYKWIVARQVNPENIEIKGMSKTKKHALKYAKEISNRGYEYEPIVARKTYDIELCTHWGKEECDHNDGYKGTFSLHGMLWDEITQAYQ